MSEPHQDPAEKNLETHPVKLAIAVTVGAFALIVGIVMLAHFAVGTHSVGNSVDRANTADAVAQRIAPVTFLAVDATKAPALVPAQVTAIPAAAPTVAMAIPVAVAVGTPAVTSGEGVYKASCVVCHGTGVAGAPKFGDKTAWSPRIAQGKPMLYDHALHGYQGKAGVMPPKGGNTALVDADVKAAVDYMVTSSK